MLLLIYRILQEEYHPACPGVQVTGPQAPYLQSPWSGVCKTRMFEHLDPQGVTDDAYTILGKEPLQSSDITHLLGGPSTQ